MNELTAHDSLTLPTMLVFCSYVSISSVAISRSSDIHTKVKPAICSPTSWVIFEENACHSAVPSVRHSLTKDVVSKSPDAQQCELDDQVALNGDGNRISKIPKKWTSAIFRTRNVTTEFSEPDLEIDE